MLLAGGNAVDAAVATLFALSVVEPMMVGILGGGLFHIRMADGRHVVLDGLSTAPARSTGDMYECLSDEPGTRQEVHDCENRLGAKAVATPGALAGWCEALCEYGTMSLEEVLQPAISFAEYGFVVTPYLHNCIADTSADLARDEILAALFLPDGKPLPVGARLVQRQYGQTLRQIAKEGARCFYGGPLGRTFVTSIARHGGCISEDDLEQYRVLPREPLEISYGGYAIFAPPPPAFSGVKIAEMLHALEGRNVAELGFGSPAATLLLSEIIKAAYDDGIAGKMHVNADIGSNALLHRASDPALVETREPTDRLPPITLTESKDTTHVTVADSFGNVVSATQTINSLFGACFAIEGTGMLTNNYMFNFDPHPGRSLSIGPGKRAYTSMSPIIAMKGGRLAFALGLPGGLRIFPSAFQAIVNLVDHGMSIQEAVEAPRVWTQGGVLELEPAIAEATAQMLRDQGQHIVRTPHVAGGMNAICFNDDGTMTGAACWRADGVPVAISGGLANADARFNLD